jgi:hypothetical protein
MKTKPKVKTYLPEVEIEAQKLIDKAIKGDTRAAQKILSLLYGNI